MLVRSGRARRVTRLGANDGFRAKMRMAKLLSYKRRDENRYSTFCNVSFGASNDSLAFRTMGNPKKKLPATSSPSSACPAVHKTYEKRSTRKGPRKRKRWISWTCCDNRKWMRRILCCPCLFCFRACRKRKNGNLNCDDDIDKAVEEYQRQQGVVVTSSAGSTLQSEKDAGGFWSWDESWKSNSDKFLESLELDGVGSDKSLKRKLRPRNSKVRAKASLERFQGSF